MPPRRPTRFAVAIPRLTPDEPAPPSLVPPVDVVDDGDSWRFVFEVPGADPASLSVEVRDRVVAVRGVRAPTEKSSGTFLRVERASGAFQRALELPEDPDPDGAEATFADGLLLLRVKKRTASRRTIPIRKGAGGRTA